MELREKIARIVCEREFGLDIEEYDGEFAKHSYETADIILELPEIKEALRYRNAVLASRLPDLLPDRVEELVRKLGNRTID